MVRESGKVLPGEQRLYLSLDEMGATVNVAEGTDRAGKGGQFPVSAASLRRTLQEEVFLPILSTVQPARRQQALRLLLGIVVRLMAEERGLVPSVLRGDAFPAENRILAALDEIGIGPPPDGLPRLAERAAALLIRLPVGRAEADPRLPGDLYAALTEERHSRGSYYTPPDLAGEVARRTLVPLLDGANAAAPSPLHVLDPAMGGGHFLIAAGEVIAAWLCDHAGLTPPEARRRALGCLHGTDRDPLAVELAALSLWLWAGAPGLRSDALSARLRCGDALLDDALFEGLPDRFDAVIGNPPFASVFTRARGERDGYRAALKARYRTTRGSFDLAVPFVERAVGLCRSGGRCGLVLPNKLLAADYARTLRRWLGERVIVEAILDYSEQRAFEADVYPVACIFRKERPEADHPLSVYRMEGSIPGPVLLRRGRQADLRDMPGEVWSGPLAPDWDMLRRYLEGTIPLGERATLSAGLTVAEAYALRPAVADAPPDGLPPRTFRLVTTGLIRRHRTRWGEVPARYLGRTYLRPVVPADALSPRRREQAASRKIIIAGLGKRLRAFVDEGEAQASVATTIITAPVWPAGALCALLNSRLASRLYRALFGGLALSGGYLRSGRRELSLFPLPDLPDDDPRLRRLDDLAGQVMAATGAAEAELEAEIEALVEALYVPAGLLPSGEA